jgi:hypothetical protein
VNKTNIVNIAQHIGNNAISYNQAETVFPLIKTAIENKTALSLNFAHINLIATPFFNGTIALAVSTYGLASTQAYITLINLSPFERNLANTCVQNALDKKIVDAKTTK